MEKILVRKEKCEGCMYSNNAMVGKCNARIGRDKHEALWALDIHALFYCHCHWGNNGDDKDNRDRVLCKGFFDKFKTRLESVFSPKFIFVNRKGNFWKRYKNATSGESRLVDDPRSRTIAEYMTKLGETK